MPSYTRTNGANAQLPGWDDFSEAPRRDRTGSWLPLDNLGDEVYVAGPQLRPVTDTGRSNPRPERDPRQATAPHPGRSIQRQPAPRRNASEGLNVSGVQARAVAILAGAALTALVLYVTVSAAVEWTQVKLDDFQYGRPRTTQLDAFVGHNEAEGVPSHFLAMNLNRRVTVIEMPGGDPTKATTIVGPYLFGQGEDLTPVQAAVQDVNADSKPDLIVSVKNEQLIYLNDGAAFKLMTPEERGALQKQLQAQAAAGAEVPVQEAGK